jgi:Tfp pilus assembly protein PilV
MPRVWFHTKQRKLRGARTPGSRSGRLGERGFSPVELLLAVTLFGALVTTLIGAMVYGRQSTAGSADHNRAMLLAEEGLEATRNIAAAGYTNLSGGGTNIGDTTIEAGSDFNTNGTSATRVNTGTSSGSVSSISVYIKTVDSTNKNVQAAIYTDNGSGTAPTTRLGVSAVQTAVANSWNSFAISGVTVTASTNYWIALSENGATTFADAGSGGTSAYRLTGGYPAPNPFAADSSNTVDKPSFYMTIGSSAGGGLAQSGGQWTFSGPSDTTDIFTRQITIADAGTNRKHVICTVSWPNGTGTSQVSVDTYMTNWLASIPSWANAVLAGSANPTGTLAGIKVATAGNYAYLVENGTTNNFVIVNISNPASPSIVSTTTVSGTPTNVAVSGNFVYITNATASTGLQIYNVSTPASPTLTKTLSFTGTAAVRGVFVNGNFAYVVRAGSTTTGSNEFNVVNVTTPASASVVGGYNNDATMNEVWASGNTAYVAQTASTTAIAEMITVNVTTPTAPALLGSYNPTGTNTTLTITGFGTTVLLGYGTTLNSVNVATPSSPASLGTFTAAGTIQDVDTNGSTYAYVGTASTTGEFQVVNVATPSTMTLAKTIDVSGTTSTVGGVAYNSSLDVVAAASASTTQRLLVFTKN